MPVLCDLCGKDLELIGVTIPQTCSNCHKPLCPIDDTLIGNLRFAYSRLFACKGRATRKEYWSFTLIHILLFLVLCTLAICLLGEIILPFLIIVSLILQILFIPITIRRFHDVNLSGKWVIARFLVDVFIIVVSVILGVYLYVDVFQSKELIFDIVSPEYTLHECESELILEDGAFLDVISHNFYLHCVLLSTLCVVSYVLTLFIFIVTFLDSSNGSNKYGFSRKYLNIQQ